MISKEVARLGPLLRPSLALLAQAVESRGLESLSGSPSVPATAQQICDDANRAQRAFATALGRLQEGGGNSITCPATAMEPLAGQCLAACGLLADVDVLARRHLGTAGGGLEAETLAQTCRDNLVLAAHFLADLIRVLCDPDAARALGGGERLGDGQVELAFAVSLKMPDRAQELSTWMPLRVAWRHDDVQTALRISTLQPTPLQQHLQRAEDVAATWNPPPASPERPGFWHLLGVGLLISWIGHALWGHDHDGSE